MKILLLLFISSPLFAGSWVQGSASNEYGTRAFAFYVPDGYSAGKAIPLLVGLHGCTQTAEDFAGLARLAPFADAHDVLVLMPKQNAFVNPTLCWNWPLVENQQRGKGEPSLIVEMIDWVEAHYSVNRARVYVFGVSSGGFMTSTLLACYADIFAAGMVASGGMYAATTNAFYGSYVGPYGSDRDPNDAGREAWVCGGSVVPRIVPLLVFHGSDDRIVIPLNAQQTIEQFAQTNDLGDDGIDNDSFTSVAAHSSSDRTPNGLACHWNDYVHHGRTVMRLFIVDGMAHAWSGGDPHFAYAEPSGPDETEIMWSFFLQNSLGATRRRAAGR